MRPAFLLSLIAFWAFMGCAVADQGGTAKSKRAQQAKAASVRDEDVIIVVQGYGKKKDDAFQDALEKAQTEVVRRLQAQDRPFLWTPSQDYIRAKLAKWPPTVESEDKEIQGIGAMVEANLTVKISRSDYRDMAQHDRQAISDWRMLLLGKVMAGLVALFGSAAGYLRLEELTKGYYTAWLRMAVFGFVALVGAGLYWFS